MKMKIEAIKNSQAKAKKKQQKKVDKPDAMNKTLQGVLINNHVRSLSPDNNFSFNDIQDSLLICETDGYYKGNCIKQNENENSFDIKKAIIPSHSPRVGVPRSAARTSCTLPSRQRRLASINS